MTYRSPNILWLMTDEQRWDSLGFSGTTWSAAATPRWDALSDSSVVYTNAYTPSPVCVPARVALLTGYRPSTAGVLSIHDPLAPSHARFLTHAFAAVGYQTASFGKQHYNHSAARAFDVEGSRAVGDRVTPMGYVRSEDEIDAGVVNYPGEDESSRWVLAGRYPGSLDETPEAEVTADALRWLENRAPDRPFFLRISFNAPHTPVVAPAPFDEQVDPAAIDLPIDREPGARPELPAALDAALTRRSGVHRLTDAQVGRARQCYYGAVAALDRLVGRILEALDRNGLRDNTWIAFCSDHGTHLGDHGFFQKQSFFEASARVPFTIAGPGVSPRRIDTPVSTGSLLPTLMRIAGLEVPDDCEYTPLAGVFDPDADEPDEPVVSEVRYGDRCDRPHDRYVMVRRGPWKLTVFRDREEPGRLDRDDGLMLFNLDQDPIERHDLAPRVGTDNSLRKTTESLLHDLDRYDRRPAARPGYAAAASTN
ncbi:MAG: sulfatase-like hydrolase/transferase [Planctomycetota bacterium]